MIKYTGNNVKTNQEYFYSAIAHRLKGKASLTCRRPSLYTKHDLSPVRQSANQWEKNTIQGQGREHELRGSPKGHSVAVRKKKKKGKTKQIEKPYKIKNK